MRIAICEDETSHAHALIKMVNDWAEQRQVYIEIKTYTSGEEYLSGSITDDRYDLLLLDMQMKLVSGLELAKIIRQTDREMIIIFVTGLIDYVLNGYEVQALRYLTKPLKQSDCFLALDKALMTINSRKEGLLFLTDNGQCVRFFLNEIYYFSVEGRLIAAHSTKGIYKFKDQLRELEERLPMPVFCRCARRLIVNVGHVYLINRDQVKLDNDEVLPVAHMRWAALNEAFLAYHKRDAMGF